MERTRFFRRPVVWIIMVIIGAIALSSFFTGRDNYTEVETSVALDRLNSGGIQKVLIEDREQSGPFETVEDLGRVKGIGPKTIENLRPYLRVNASAHRDQRPD